MFDVYFFVFCCVSLSRIYFYRGDGIQDCVPLKFHNFLGFSFFLKILGQESFDNLQGNSFTKFLIPNIKVRNTCGE